jgi:nucleoside recognition membrane protein YjiH
MILDMVLEIPVRFGQLILLFLIRTALLLPILAGVVHLLQLFHVLQ